ncbi:MAG: hypothetical protein IJQ37_00280 [Clostridia bacterium]|nr:hypothetical protein [Clostridia bacterium]
MDKKIFEISSGWRLYYAENAACRDYADKITSEAELISRGLENVAASVPGNFVLDLFRAGKIPDPIYADNSWKLQYLEAMHVWYCVSFDADFDDDSYLRFDGLDTIADVYLDGEHILRAENMFIPHFAKARGASRHELVVHFTPAVIEGRKYKAPASSNALWYNYQGLYIRKAAYMYGWDIMPRIVSCGIWKPVCVMKRRADSINDVFVYTLFTKPDEKRAKIRIYFDISVSGDLIQKYRLRFSGKCGTSSFCEEITPWGTQYSRMAFIIENARLWWPRGYGEPNLYDCRAELLLDGEVLDTYTLKVGLRTVELVRTDSIKDGEGEFLFKINQTPIFWRGVNWSPLSPYPSENEKMLPEGLSRLYETGSNCVRMWGGGIYEDDSFFDFCDAHGIMVWQDFMMACAVYPQDETFEKKLKEEAVYQICRLRSHPSLVLWSGDNECDCTYNTWGGVVRNPNENVITRKLLPQLIRTHDFSRPYLPSSPYISDECYTLGLHSPEEHLWGDRPHYLSDYYSKSECRFVSEIGHHGAVSPESARKFIEPQHLYPILRDNGEVDEQWLCHATETWQDVETPYKYRMKMLVRKVVEAAGKLPVTYAQFSKVSQVLQAEAVKRFIEIFRGEKWRRTGIIYWNLTDGWPLSCESVIDCYGTHKIAFYFMRRAYEPIYLMIKDGGDGKTLVAANDTLDECDVDFTVTDVDGGTIICRGSKKIKANDVTELDKITLDTHDTFAKISWRIGGREYSSHYFADVTGCDMTRYLNCLEKCGFDEFEGF